ncbi:MAG TPA: TIR domain-containing protein [Lachnospiraceae bacterium]|nr:TIR domain-containing protein [Lachnospiraceae bacterium]
MGIGVSYCSKDRETLDNFESRIKHLGVKLHRYDIELQSGQSIFEYIKSLTSQEYNFVWLSKSYLKSPFCIYELSELLNKNNLLVIYLDKEEIGSELIDARQFWIEYIKNDKQKELVSWVRSKICNINFVSLFDKFENTLEKRYLVFSILLTKEGIKEVLNFLSYTPDEYIKRLEKILQLKSFSNREDAFEKYLEEGIANETFYFYEALSCRNEGYYEMAVNYLKRSIRKNQGYSSAYIELLNIVIQTGNEQYIEEVNFEFLPEKLDIQGQASFYIVRGLHYLNKAQETMNAESERNYAQLAILNWIKGGILSDWSFAEVYNDMGNAYELLGFISDSLNCYTKAIDLKSDYYQAYSNLALLLHKYFYTPENYKRAELLYKKCLEIKPDYQYALSNYALLLEESDWKAALQKDVEFLCAPFGQYTDFITNMALILEEEKISPELAGMFYANLCKVKPHSLATKFNLANFKRRRGDSFDEVYKLLNDVLKGMPNSDIVNFTLALLYARDKNWKRVIEICEADKERHRYYIPDDILIGWSRIQINDEKKAIINDLISSIEKYNSIDNKKNKDYAILLGLLHYEIYSLLVDGKGKCLLHNKSTESCRPEMEKVASPFWRKLQSHLEG